MTTESDERPVNLKAFEKLPAGEPVVMINLLKFKEQGGRERYPDNGSPAAIGTSVGTSAPTRGGSAVIASRSRVSRVEDPPC